MPDIYVSVGSLKVDGQQIIDYLPVNRWLPEWRQRTLPVLSFDRGATGLGVEEWHSQDLGSDWRLASLPMRSWEAIVRGTIDAQALEMLQEVFYGPYKHNMCTNVNDVAYAHVDGVRTDLILDRAILSDGYTRTTIFGTQPSGSGAALSFEIKNPRTGTIYTKIYSGSPAAGEVLIERTGTYAWRKATFNATDIATIGAANGESALRLRGLWLYDISIPNPPVEGYVAGGGGAVLPEGFNFTIEERGAEG